jgi:hypothetical protein
VKREIKNLKLEWGLVLLFLFPTLGKAVEGVKLVCAEPVYSFGTVEQSAVVTNVFVIRNEGDLTFVAGVPRTTCSCTRAQINRQMIGPGESAELTAVFTAARRSGEQVKAVILPASNPAGPLLKVYMKGTVNPPALAN